MTEVFGSVDVDPFLVLDDAEAEMDLWTPRWLESDGLSTPDLPVETWGGWAELPLWLAPAPEPDPAALWGSIVRSDKEEPDLLPSLSAWNILIW
jgi:hypothetical protein